MASFCEFKTNIISDFYKSIRNKESNNYDYFRFSYDGVDRSDWFNSAEHEFFLCWLFDNFESIFKAFSSLEDETSRKIYQELLIYRLVGHLHCKLSFSKKDMASDLSEFRKVDNSIDSDIKIAGMFGGLRKYDFSWEGKNYNINCMKD